MDVLKRDGVMDLIGAQFICDDISAAVEMYMSKHPRHAPDSPDTQDS